MALHTNKDISIGLQSDKDSDYYGDYFKIDSDNVIRPYKPIISKTVINIKLGDFDSICNDIKIQGNKINITKTARKYVHKYIFDNYNSFEQQLT